MTRQDPSLLDGPLVLTSHSLALDRAFREELVQVKLRCIPGDLQTSCDHFSGHGPVFLTQVIDDLHIQVDRNRETS